MCVSCHEPLNTVSSPQAISEKQALARLIAKGDNMQQIQDTMVSYYGVQVLARPPASGVNLLIYILPPRCSLADRFARLHAPTLAGARPPSRPGAAGRRGSAVARGRGRGSTTSSPAIPRAESERWSGVAFPSQREARRHIESGALTPSRSSTSASVEWVATHSAIRKVSTSAGVAPTTLQSR